MIALATAGIALQQSRLARRKLRLDLFEKRFRVYDVVLQGMVDALNFNEEKVLDQSTHGLNRTLREARFLFRARTYNYRHSSMIMRTHQIAEGESGAAIIRQHSEDSLWLLNNTRILPSRLHDDLRVDDHLSFSLIMDSEAFKLMQSRRTGS